MTTASAASAASAAVSATMATTGSPTKRTTPSASSDRPMAAGYDGLTGGTRPRSTSAATTTSTTPGMARAADTSTESIRACATGETT
jgi:hypothetical protein